MVENKRRNISYSRLERSISCPKTRGKSNFSWTYGWV